MLHDTAMLLYDISPLICPGWPVWPGDTPLSREVLLDMHRGDNLTLSTMRATVHLGAHADAPSHYGADAPTVERCDIARYIGPCEVVRVAAVRGARVTREALGSYRPRTERVLIATGTAADRTRFNEDFAALAPALVDWLHETGVRLVGIDTPSVDLFDDRQLTAHRRFLAHGMLILEGLVLDGVTAGEYELIALPLKLEGFDASPVRAVLRR
jgi:arylformamidase